MPHPLSVAVSATATRLGNGQVLCDRLLIRHTHGKPTEFTIALYPTSLVFQRGHRIRIDISSSNFPRFDANPNTYEPLNANTRWRIAANAIYHDPEHPSHVVLPVIPGEP